MARICGSPFTETRAFAGAPRIHAKSNHAVDAPVAHLLLIRLAVKSHDAPPLELKRERLNSARASAMSSGIPRIF